MIPRACKRLAEVDFPIAVVSKHSAREKSIRHGHPSTLHLWWARRPLAACRSILLALLLPDPCDGECPPDFKRKARELLPRVQGEVGRSDEALRKALLKFIGDFSNWDLAANKSYLEVGRALVKAAHGEEAPLVVDPFAGGGSIPLEALRLGCETFASDLNPVACLILKVMLEDIPRHGPKLADELRRVGAEIKAQAEKELRELYPKDPDGAIPIAYLWARTVRCESPACGAEIPLMRSLWLCKKARRKRALRYRVERPKNQRPRIVFEVFEPRGEKQVGSGTVSRARATCLACGIVLPPERVRIQLAAQQGGADVVFDAKGRRTGGALMLAVVTVRLGERGRHYRLPEPTDYKAVRKAQRRVRRILSDWEMRGKQGLCPVPDELLPPLGTLGFRVQRYGMLQWGDLFTARQKVALLELGKCLRSAPASVGETGSAALSRLADKNASLAIWNQVGEKIEHVFGRQALPIVWDFAEVSIFSHSTGNFFSGVELVAKVVRAWPGSIAGQVQPADATRHLLPDQTAHVWFTDPPYYDAVPYADLSDFFFVWLKRALPGHQLLQDPFDPENQLTPKRQEAVQDETKYDNGEVKDRDWFEGTMARAFAEGRRVLGEDGIGCVVFAHKTTEGWEALLTGMVLGGWTITGSWPVATERPGRLRSQDSAALATSVHLICRPRPTGALVGDWAIVLRELPERVGDLMERLQAEGIRGADLVFACIGPALEIFSRYDRVETAEGRRIALAEYLEKLWEVVGRTALRQVLGTDAPGDFGEDARLTALFLWALRGTNEQSDEQDLDEARSVQGNGSSQEAAGLSGYSLPYDIVRRIAQPLGIRLDQWIERLIRIDKGVVTLVPVAERAPSLVEPGVAHDLMLLTSKGKDRSRDQLRLFDDPSFTEGQRKEQAARSRVEQATWSQLHLDSITTLDHVHKAMLLQSQGQTNALRELLVYERHYRPEFVRLANALSALYARGSEEKRLLDAMLLAVPK